MPKTKIAQSTATRTGIIAAVLMVVGIFGALTFFAKSLPAVYRNFNRQNELNQPMVQDQPMWVCLENCRQEREKCRDQLTRSEPREKSDVTACLATKLPPFWVEFCKIVAFGIPAKVEECLGNVAGDKTTQACVEVVRATFQMCYDFNDKCVSDCFAGRAATGGGTGATGGAARNAYELNYVQPSGLQDYGVGSQIQQFQRAPASPTGPIQPSAPGSGGTGGGRGTGGQFLIE